MTSWPNRELDLKMAAHLKLDYTRKHQETHTFVSISREYGCDGKAFAKALVKLLNEKEKDQECPWMVFDRDALLQVADPSEIDEQSLGLLDEYGHSEFAGYIQEAIFRHKNQFQVIQNLANITRMLARRGHAVFVGRGATVLTQDIEGGLHFRLYAPLEWRVQNHAKRWSLDTSAARQRVEENQKQRESFVKTYLSMPIDRPSLYDMMFNNAKVSAEQAAQLAFALKKAKQK